MMPYRGNHVSTVDCNRDEPLCRVRHADLRRLSDESVFKVYCPACTEGVLLVKRDPETLDLISEDRCLFCGQWFVYEDETIGGEPVTRVEP